MPDTHCLRRCHCCAFLPDVTFLEALSAFSTLSGLEPPIRNKIFKRLVGYFFLNALEITACPFLEGNHCFIYAERFFGCRAYGLWSPGYYEKLSENSRRAKQDLESNWRRLGISLPREVIDFYQPYCLRVAAHSDAAIDDAALEDLDGRLDMISERYTEWHSLFVHTYFSDISFLAASLVFGVKQATRMKFHVVRENLFTGRWETLNRLVEGLPDFELI